MELRPGQGRLLVSGAVLLDLTLTLYGAHALEPETHYRVTSNLAVNAAESNVALILATNSARSVSSLGLENI